MTDLGFVGTGRIAHSLALALSRAGYRVAAVANRSHGSAERLATALPDCEALPAQGVVDRCDLVFLTVPDAAIAPVAAALHWRAGQAVVHCSGATEVSALDPAIGAGAMAGGFHPLLGFSGMGETPLAGCTITMEADPPLAGMLEAMIAALGCRLNRLPPGKRALYHASAGYGAGFIHVLMAEIAGVWGEWGASEADMLAAILPMARTTLDTIERGGIAQTMPGPISRGDAGSVAAHLDAMAGMPEVDAFYRAHSLRSVDIAEGTGRIDGEAAARLRALLRRPSPDAE